MTILYVWIKLCEEIKKKMQTCLIRVHKSVYTSKNNLILKSSKCLLDLTSLKFGAIWVDALLDLRMI